MSWRKCMCLLTTDRNAWGTWRSARVPGKATVAWPTEGKNILKPRGEQRKSAWFQYITSSFLGRQTNCTQSEFNIRIFWQTFLISWVSFNIQTYKDLCKPIQTYLHLGNVNIIRGLHWASPLQHFAPSPPGFLLNTVFFSKNAFLL